MNQFTTRTGTVIPAAQVQHGRRQIIAVYRWCSGRFAGGLFSAYDYPHSPEQSRIRCVVRRHLIQVPAPEHAVGPYDWGFRAVISPLRRIFHAPQGRAPDRVGIERSRIWDLVRINHPDTIDLTARESAQTPPDVSAGRLQPLAVDGSG
jgi:hypothetical protein